ncbi:MAG: hypothetical protein ACRD3W_17430, partial [Terriglobales bacterium]
SNAPKEPSTQKKTEPKKVTLIYRNQKFVSPADVHLKEGDTITFIASTDLEDPTMVITLDKEFFQPTTFKNSDPPVKVIKDIKKGGRSQYKCHFSGTLNGQPGNYNGHGGGFVVP